MTPRRFWKDVTVKAGQDGYAILLDNRALKTPMKQDLLLPNENMAQAIAKEWLAVEELITPGDMPMTGFANAAIDKVAADKNAFAGAIAAYAESDLLCYRAAADEQAALAKRQHDIWQPRLDWAAERYNISFTLVEGIIHKAQPSATLETLQKIVALCTIFELAAMAKIAHLTGSLVLTLVLFERAAEGEDIWHAACLDELWQEEHWGSDYWAEKNRNDREAEFMAAIRFLKLVQAT